MENEVSMYTVEQITNTIINGKCEEVLPLVPPQSIDCIVTSPPYWGLRDYGLAPSSWPEITFIPVAGLPPVVIPEMVCCLGLESDPWAFVAHLVHIFRLARPAIKEDGTVWLNLGDTYYGGKGSNGNTKARLTAEERGYKQPKGTVVDDVRPQDRPIKGLKPKDLAGIPWRVAMALQADGWYFRQDIIWNKPNPMPESVTDRCTKAHEYVFLFAKSEKYFFNADAIKEKSVMYGTDKRSDKGNIRYEGKRSEDTKKNGQDSFVTITEYRNKRSVWNIATRSYTEAHFATFPVDLPATCIKASLLGKYEGGG